MTAESRRYRYDGENGRGRSPRLPVLASGGFFHAAGIDKSYVFRTAPPLFKRDLN